MIVVYWWWRSNCKQQIKSNQSSYLLQCQTILNGQGHEERNDLGGQHFFADSNFVAVQ